MGATAIRARRVEHAGGEVGHSDREVVEPGAAAGQGSGVGTVVPDRLEEQQPGMALADVELARALARKRLDGGGFGLELEGAESPFDGGGEHGDVVEGMGQRRLRRVRGIMARRGSMRVAFGGAHSSGGAPRLVARATSRSSRSARSTWAGSTSRGS